MKEGARKRCYSADDKANEGELKRHRSSSLREATGSDEVLQAVPEEDDAESDDESDDTHLSESFEEDLEDAEEEESSGEDEADGQVEQEDQESMEDEDEVEDDEEMALPVSDNESLHGGVTEDIISASVSSSFL